MPMDMPPSVPAQSSYAAAAPECNYLSAVDAHIALKRLRAALPSTEFSGARPSEVCGMVRVEMASGKVAYTDTTGRYLLLAFAIDTHRGGPADNQDTLDHALKEREQFPKDAIPGLMPEPAMPDDGPLMSPIQLIPSAPQAFPR